MDLQPVEIYFLYSVNVLHVYIKMCSSGINFYSDELRRKKKKKQKEKRCVKTTDTRPSLRGNLTICSDPY